MAATQSNTKQLEGRVFTRLRQFSTLDQSLQQDVADCREYLTAKREVVFEKHHPHLIKGVIGVKGKELIEIIDTWLAGRSGSTGAGAGARTHGTRGVSLTGDQSARAKAEAVAATSRTPVDSADPRAYAKQLINGLVLSGFFTPYSESEKTPDTSHAARDFFGESEVYVPVMPPLADSKTRSVWAVVDGAVFAGWMKRKAGLIAQLTQGKDTYVVINESLKGVFFFDSDVGHAPVSEFEGPFGTHVAFDSEHFELGVRIWNGDRSELLNAGTPSEQEALMSMLVGIGAQCDTVRHQSTMGHMKDKMDPRTTTTGHHGHESTMGRHGGLHHQEPMMVDQDRGLHGNQPLDMQDPNKATMGRRGHESTLEHMKDKMDPRTTTGTHAENFPANTSGDMQYPHNATMGQGGNNAPLGGVTDRKYETQDPTRVQRDTRMLP